MKKKCKYLNISSCSGCLLLKYIFLPKWKASKAKTEGEIEQKDSHKWNREEEGWKVNWREDGRKD